MSKIYDALQSAYKARLEKAKAQNDQQANSQPPPGSHSPTLPKFHEEAELQALAQNIATHLPNPDQNVIQFISSQAGEGASTLIREFAFMVAQNSGKPVLLVDADIKHPSHAQAFGLESKPPLDYVLKEGKPLDGVICMIEQSNLFLATLSSNFFRSLTERSSFHSTDMWKAARNRFSLILIDSAPASDSNESLALCETVNGVILVLASEKNSGSRCAKRKKTNFGKRRESSWYRVYKKKVSYSESHPQVSLASFHRT